MTASTVTPVLPLLKEGDSGDAVRFLEQLLVSIWWFSRDRYNLIHTEVSFDAKYDSITTQAVREFQENYNRSFPSPDIIVDGIVGEQTWQALGDAIFRATY